MRRLAQRPRQQDFLPLPLAHFLQVVVKQLAWAVHVPQNRLEERFVHLRISDEVTQTAAQIIHPLPHGVREIFSRFKKIVVCELNEGQFANYLRHELQEFSYEQYNKCEGQPFTIVELREKFESLLK